MCPDCIKVKDKPLTYTKCRKCEGWREMTPAEKGQASKPWRFDGSGEATKKY